GSVVRVSPEGKRTIHNNGTEPMVVLCVQYRETPFTQDDATDGVILKDQVKW
ncbi:MAG: cupin domain-containing protein, partial [Prevotella sp.]|nr:cupin domain-containing protein [Prevotella sp.]